MKSGRLQAITEYVAERGVVPLAELESHFGVSMSTLRRDIAELSRQGSLTKTYGCVSKSPEAAEPVVPFHLRSSHRLGEKTRAARVAASFVRDGDFIFIDSGSTTCMMVDFLGDRRDVSIVTNNLDVVMRAVSFPNLNIYILPGLLNRENNSFTTLPDEPLLGTFNITKAFLACSGLSLRSGVSHTYLSEGALKRKVLSLADERYLVLDETKFGALAPLRLCGVEDFTAVCTSRRPSEEYTAYFGEKGIQLAFEE